MTPDPAIQTALEMLDDFICECGHLKDDHLDGACTDCDCPEFRPVNFFVQRADLREAVQ